MIIRVYRCTVVKGMEAEFREFAFKTSHPWLRERPGLVAFYAGRPLPGSDDRDRCMVQIWESPEAIRDSPGRELASYADLAGRSPGIRRIRQRRAL